MMVRKNQTGVALVVALVALIVLTVIGISTMGELLTQSSTVRNEQFRQRAFYAASSELNALVELVNGNPSSAEDAVIDDLRGNKITSNTFGLDRTASALTSPVSINLPAISLQARRNDLLGCSGESVGKVKVLSGTIDATAQLSDGNPNSGIRSHQRQRFVYCWP